MDKKTKECINELKQEELVIESEIKSLQTKLEKINEDKWKIYAKIKIDSDKIECSYCGYFASKKENPEEALTYNESIRNGYRYYCGNCSE